MTKVKICGINDTAGFDSAVEAGADWIGFNFFPASPRYVAPATAAAMSRRGAGFPPLVGLFVDPSVDTINQVLDFVRLDALQIYGALGDLPAIKDRFGLPVWRAVGVSSRADLPTELLGASTLVVEAKPPAGATRPGGNATVMDWSLLLGWTAPLPWLLAGGLTVANVASAIKATAAKAVDVSSGVERRKGVKDAALIKAFIRAAKATS